MEVEKERHKASSEQGDDLMAVVENEHQKLQTMVICRLYFLRDNREFYS